MGTAAHRVIEARALHRVALGLALRNRHGVGLELPRVARPRPLAVAELARVRLVVVLPSWRSGPCRETAT
jgi:hypothetical protein